MPIHPFSNLGLLLGVSPAIVSIIIGAIIVWTLILKGFALWHAARNYQKRWFIALLVVNSVGVLDIIYLVWFRKDKREGRTPSLFNAPEGPSSSA